MLSATPEDRNHLTEEIFGTRTTSETLSAYFKMYNRLLDTSTLGTVVQIDPPLVRSHEDILRLIHLLKNGVHCTHAQFVKLALDELHPRAACQKDCGAGACAQSNPLILKELKEAINLAIQLLFMVDCAAKEKHSDDHEIEGFKHVEWGDGEPFVSFVQRILPAEQTPTQLTREEKNMLKAWKLCKRAGVTLKPTHNILEHLLYDPFDNTVWIFHHAAFLKAQLKPSTNLHHELTLKASLSSGTLPPRLLHETLSSLQDVLFSCIDRKSTGLLEELVNAGDNRFDVECLTKDGQIKELSRDPEYVYWNKRLKRLVSLVTNPKPRHRFGRWLQRHTSDRNALYVAIVALLISAFFGFLSVIIGIIQTWIAWQSWKSQ